MRLFPVAIVRVQTQSGLATIEIPPRALTEFQEMKLSMRVSDDMVVRKVLFRDGTYYRSEAPLIVGGSTIVELLAAIRSEDDALSEIEDVFVLERQELFERQERERYRRRLEEKNRIDEEKAEKARRREEAIRLKRAGITCSVMRIKMRLSEQPKRRRVYSESEVNYLLNFLDESAGSKEEKLRIAIGRMVFAAWHEGHSDSVISDWIGLSKARVGQILIRADRHIRRCYDEIKRNGPIGIQDLSNIVSLSKLTR